jgi:hypothetical protein
MLRLFYPLSESCHLDAQTNLPSEGYTDPHVHPLPIQLHIRAFATAFYGRTERKRKPKNSSVLQRREIIAMRWKNTSTSSHPSNNKHGRGSSS